MYEKLKIVQGAGHEQVFMLNYKEEEKGNDLVITARLTIHKDNRYAQRLLKRANDRDASPLTIVLKDHENQRKRDKKHDE